ncbi:hypothetical protein [Streptomyces sp. NPDC089919]|uniref:HAAS signaling domain-containing protein n=1 Tax=Streptomyces sp. NPDC089919 TaxID=3155188 RepID=UPI003421CAC1
MKTTADPVAQYLTAVEREASTLPADRRQELLADLSEHIEVTRAERPAATVAEILAELGDPRAIAATALAEAGGPAPAGPAVPGAAAAPVRRGKVHPLVPLLMLGLSLPFVMVFSDQPGPVFGVLFRLAGAVLLCTSVHWSAVQKTTGVLLTTVLPIVVMATVNLSGGGPAVGTETLVANLALTAAVGLAAGWLWRTRRA